MKKFISLFFAVCLLLPLFSQQRGADIPNLARFVTLKCDFHIHTIFSDGTVWPTVRVDEAVREGLDAISLTEHIEYRPYISDYSHNRAYEIAKPHADARGIILIHGSEITRAMPPGHHNVIFISDADKLDAPDWMDAMRAAKEQNAFFFWNHPGWVSQQPDTTMWFAEHTLLLEQGMMHGIEVVNGASYYPEAHRWCLEKNLTFIGTSDAHSPVFPYAQGSHRSITLVFARERSAEAINEALRAGRTAVYFNNFVIGREIYLKELFENALEWNMSVNDNIVTVSVTNNSDLVFHLNKTNHDPRLTYFRNTSVEPFIIAPQSTRSFTVRLLDGLQSGDVNFIVENFLTQPNQGMDYTLKVSL